MSRATPEPKRIVFIITGLFTGGAEKALLKLLELIDRKKFSPYVISLINGGDIKPRIASLGIPVETVGMKRGMPDPIRFFHLVRLLRRIKPDIVHTWMYHADLLGGMAGRLAGVPVVIWGVHSADFTRAGTSILTRITVSCCAKLSPAVPDCIQYVSQYAKDFHNRIGYRERHSRIIPNGVDLDEFKPSEHARDEVRRELGISSKTPLIGLISRFHPIKNIEGFIEAAGYLHRVMPDARFLLAGQSMDRSNPALMRMIADAGLSGAVHLLGICPDISRITAALDLATLTSWNESFGIVLIEAMACGVPCVSTDNGVQSAIIGDTGWVVPVGDMKGIAEKWAAFFSMPEQDRRRMGEAAHARVVEGYDLGAIVREYEAMYGDEEKRSAPVSSLKKALPWWLKIGAKIVLARLPVSYAFWKRIGLFEHGDMNQPLRAFDTFMEHARTAGLVVEGSPPRLRVKDDGAVLELGPGDSLCTAVIAASFGVSRTYAVDAGFYATTDPAPYARLVDHLRGMGLPVPLDALSLTFDALLEKCRAEYLTEGVHSLRRLASGSVGYCFSNAVLEHIPKQDFPLLAQELFRVMKPDGVSVHQVDLRDHLGGGLNHLRFTEKTWEGALFRESGFYTNRIRFGEMISLFTRAGFDCQLHRVVRWDGLPTPRARLDASFRHLPEDDLLVSHFDLILTRRA